ncbi:hypothetical protein C8T65DRAFT_80827 [Cerioporus squamosus]|nr:hypothetical protein C8T65DRAFT_159473 [Cerioporus squamosus]KAI0718589.1 hypothetical protein C8T65DRAFT_80827 [Cerioporus squamosus]
MLSSALRTLAPLPRLCLASSSELRVFTPLSASSGRSRSHSRYTNAHSSLWLAKRASSMSSTVAKDVPADPSAPAPGPPTSKDQELPQFNFPVSPVPENPLGEGRYIRTAAALVIGDEILNGKTLDRNSNYFARFCFENGIDLKRIEVIPDDEDDMCVWQGRRRARCMR